MLLNRKQAKWLDDTGIENCVRYAVKQFCVRPLNALKNGVVTTVGPSLARTLPMSFVFDDP